MKEEGMSQDAGPESAGTATESFVPPAAQPQKKAEPERFIRVNAWGPAVAGWGERGLKHAVVEFLNDLAAGAYDDIPAPQLVFGTSAWQLTLKLRRHPDGMEYVAFGGPSGDEVPMIVQSIFAATTAGERRPMVESRAVVYASGSPMPLEHQLRRFAVNEKLQMLIVNFNLGRQLRIWKRPHGYGIAAVSLPATESAW